MLFYVQAAFLSCVTVSGLWGLKHAHKASGVFRSELVVFGRWGLSSASRQVAGQSSMEARSREERHILINYNHSHVRDWVAWFCTLVWVCIRLSCPEDSSDGLMKSSKKMPCSDRKVNGQIGKYRKATEHISRGPPGPKYTSRGAHNSLY